MQMHGSKGIKKPKKPDPLNSTEPLIHPQGSATMKKNRSEAMRAFWSKRKMETQSAKDDAGDSDEAGIEMRQVVMTLDLRGSGSNAKPARMSISNPNSSELGLRAILQVLQEKDFSFTDMAILDP